MTKNQKRKCQSPEEFDIHFDVLWTKKPNHILRNFFKKFCEDYKLYPMSHTVFHKRFQTIEQIYEVNKLKDVDSLKILVDEFYSTKSNIRRQDIKHGEGSGESYSKNLKEKAKNNVKSVRHIEYWINKGLSLEDAKQAKKDYYKQLVGKASSANRKKFQEDPDKFRERYKDRKMPHSKKYWRDLGYSEEDVERIVKELRRPFLCNLEGFVERHGEEMGSKKWEDCKEKRNSTRMKNYGTLFISSHVSKSSLKFFIPLYKKLRKLGIGKNDIVWGIANKKEFITHDKHNNKNYAYDFVIKSKKVIVEYNDPFWHARIIEEWRNPFIKYEDSLEFDRYKKTFVENMGFKVLTVWADALPTYEELITNITNE